MKIKDFQGSNQRLKQKKLWFLLTFNDIEKVFEKYGHDYWKIKDLILKEFKQKYGIKK